MKLIMVDFNIVDEDGLVRSRLDRANVPLYVGDMVLAYDADKHSCLATVVSTYNGTVRIAIDPANELVEV